MRKISYHFQLYRVAELQDFLDLHKIKLQIFNNSGKFNSELSKRLDFKEFIINETLFLNDNLPFRVRRDYYLFGVNSQDSCIICKKLLKTSPGSSKYCSMQCHNNCPEFKEKCKLSKSIIDPIDGKNSYERGSIKAIASRPKDENGKIILNEIHKSNIRTGRTRVDESGLTSAQKGGITQSNNMTDELRKIKSLNSKLSSNIIIFYDFASKEYWSRSKLNNVLLAERMKLDIDPLTGKNAIRIKNDKGGVTKRKGKSQSDIKEYRRSVLVITNNAIKLNSLENIDLRGAHRKGNNAFHVDHIVSISEGFHNNIPPYIIGSIHNLRCIHWHDNITKSAKSEMSINELCDRLFNPSK